MIRVRKSQICYKCTENLIVPENQQKYGRLHYERFVVTRHKFAFSGSKHWPLSLNLKPVGIGFQKCPPPIIVVSGFGKPTILRLGPIQSGSSSGPLQANMAYWVGWWVTSPNPKFLTRFIRTFPLDFSSTYSPIGLFHHSISWTFDYTNSSYSWTSSYTTKIHKTTAATTVPEGLSSCLTFFN